MPLRPTSELRFVRRVVRAGGPDGITLYERTILQQKWNEFGSTWVGPNEPPFEWRDVPLVEDFSDASQ